MICLAVVELGVEVQLLLVALRANSTLVSLSVKERGERWTIGFTYLQNMRDSVMQNTSLTKLYLPQHFRNGKSGNRM